MRLALIAAVLLLATTPVHALCAYNGILYYETTLQEEYADAPLVVRAKVTADRNDLETFEKLGKADWHSFYTLKVIQTFKGKAPASLVDVTERNSGGFYLDVDKEYLLFLTPYPRERGIPKGAMAVNYNCGQSQEWKKVSAKDRAKLDDLIRFTIGPKR